MSTVCAVYINDAEHRPVLHAAPTRAVPTKAWLVATCGRYVASFDAKPATYDDMTCENCRAALTKLAVRSFDEPAYVRLYCGACHHERVYAPDDAPPAWCPACGHSWRSL